MLYLECISNSCPTVKQSQECDEASQEFRMKASNQPGFVVLSWEICGKYRNNSWSSGEPLLTQAIDQCGVNDQGSLKWVTLCNLQLTEHKYEPGSHQDSEVSKLCCSKYDFICDIFARTKDKVPLGGPNWNLLIIQALIALISSPPNLLCW